MTALREIFDASWVHFTDEGRPLPLVPMTEQEREEDAKFYALVMQRAKGTNRPGI